LGEHVLCTGLVIVGEFLAAGNAACTISLFTVTNSFHSAAVGWRILVAALMQPSMGCFMYQSSGYMNGMGVGFADMVLSKLD
jgi:hypothetical protein